MERQIFTVRGDDFLVDEQGNVWQLRDVELGVDWVLCAHAPRLDDAERLRIDEAVREAPAREVVFKIA